MYSFHRMLVKSLQYGLVPIILVQNAVPLRQAVRRAEQIFLAIAVGSSRWLEPLRLEDVCLRGVWRGRGGGGSGEAAGAEGEHPWQKLSQ